LKKPSSVAMKAPGPNITQLGLLECSFRNIRIYSYFASEERDKTNYWIPWRRVLLGKPTVAQAFKKLGILCRLKTYYLIHRSPRLVPILS
jgi:hypothetical protein